MNHQSETWTRADHQNSEPDFYAKWISVEERLPEYDKSVLISNSEGVEIAILINAEADGADSMGIDSGFIGAYAMPGRTFGAKRYQHEEQGQPTHWMELPQHKSLEEQGAC